MRSLEDSKTREWTGLEQRSFPVKGSGIFPFKLKRKILKEIPSILFILSFHNGPYNYPILQLKGAQKGLPPLLS